MTHSDRTQVEVEDKERMMQWVLSTEVTVPYPLASVWSLFRDARRWYPEYTWTVVSGPSYEDNGGLLEGQTLKVRSSHPLPRIPGGDEVVPDDYLTKILKVIPQEEVVLVASGGVYDLRRYTLFYVWRLSEDEAGASTTIGVDTYGEGEFVNPLSAQELAEYVDSFNANWYRSWSTAFGNLRKILDTENG